jgi:ADP-ribose pyrophosphatase YjhB (NUDIX family)
MGFEPQKFFIGVIDFFSIILPGALLVYLLGGFHGVEGTEPWLVFLFASYLMGHLLNLIGAIVFDDAYKRLVGAALETRTERLAEGQAPSAPIFGFWAKILLAGNNRAALQQARRIKESYLDPIDAAASINTFQWAKARLAIEQPQALAAVERFEADSKFFRSFGVALFILTIWWLIVASPLLTLATLVLLIFSFRRFAQLRSKSTQEAYWYIITLEGRLERPRDLNNSATHAGGVVRRGADGARQYLLVQAKNPPNDWVLPKGHIKDGEGVREAAVREVHEETGVWARVVHEIGTSRYSVADELIRVRFFLMESEEEAMATESDRKHDWFSFEKAVSLAIHKETKKLLIQCHSG